MTTWLLPLMTVWVDIQVEDDAPPSEVSWPMIMVFVGLLIAVIAIGWGLRWQLKRIDRSADQGVFGEPPTTPAEPGEQREH